MKKVFLMILAGTLTLASCVNDYDKEMVRNDLYSQAEIAAANTTISEIRKEYSNTISNNSYEMVNEDKIIEGVVVANDISGNIYQTIYIQGINADGTLNTEEGGIGIKIKGIGCLYTLYPVGQKIRINLKNLYVGGYGAAPLVGMPYINTNGAMKLGPMTLPMMKSNIIQVGNPRPELVVAKEMTGTDFNATNISKYTPMLIVIKNSEIKDAGWPYAHWEAGGDVYSEYHDINVGGTNVKQLLYTSTSASFAGDTIQSGKKTIYGLLSRYSSSYQLSLRSIDDIIELGK